MKVPRTIFLYDQDRSVVAALQFALRLEGYAVIDGSAGGADPGEAGCLVIEQRLGPEPGLALLQRLRRQGCAAPAILLCTNPSTALRKQVAEAGAHLVEKPLLDDALTQEIRALTGDKAHLT